MHPEHAVALADHRYLTWHRGCRGASGSQRKTTQRSRASLDAPPNIAPRDDAQPSPASLGARQNRAESPTTTAQPEFLSAHEMTLVKRIAEFEAQRAEFDRACQSKETKLRLRELEIEQLHINAERVALEVADHKFELEEVRAELDRATKRLGELRSTLNEEVGDRNGVAGIDSVARFVNSRIFSVFDVSERSVTLTCYPWLGRQRWRP